MTPESKQALRKLLIDQEEYKQFPYVDSQGYLTVGVGRNLTTRGISQSEALYLLDDDLLYFTQKLNQYLPFFNKLSEARQIALISMCFNLGVQGFLNFKNMIIALESENYDLAADEMLNSLAAHQAREGYMKLADIMRRNEL